MDEKFIQIVDGLQQSYAEQPFRDSTDDINELSIQNKQKIDKQSVDAANILVNYFWSNKGAPLQIGDMLEALGFAVILDDTSQDDKLSGALAIDNNSVDYFKKMIIINSKDNIGHQRFTIAHELAHYIFDALPEQEYYEAYYRTDESKNNEIREYRANQFAANLLMPESIFVPRYNYVATKIKDSQTVQMILSLDFGVSKTAIIKRIEELNLGVI